jgi:hypothetical protein
MAAIYEKALKRKDFSGIIDKEKAKSKDPTPPKAVTKEDKAKAKADEQKADDPKAGAGSQLFLAHT